MRVRRQVAKASALLSAILTAGCGSGDAFGTRIGDPPIQPRAADVAALGMISATPTTRELDCPCEPLSLELPARLPSDGWLDLRVHWDGTASAGAAATLRGPAGERTGRRGFDSSRIKLQAAAAGAYQLAIEGAGHFTVVAFTRSASQPKTAGAQRLPNIVVMVPEQVGFGACDTVEQTERGARRCLCLGNAIGNTGDGPLEVHLGWVDAALALAGEAQPVVDGMFVQRLYGWDGVPTDRAVGASDFHPAHAHWHYDGFADFRLYAVDPLTGLRGAEAGMAQKSGFCFLDWGAMVEREARREDGGRAAQDCLVPAAEAGWSMGISTGWFDFYWRELTDQYVEASGVGSGLFELVSRADPEDWLLEVDETDNAASVLLRIEGDEVKVLERRGWYDIPPGTANF